MAVNTGTHQCLFRVASGGLASFGLTCRLRFQQLLDSKWFEHFTGVSLDLMLGLPRICYRMEPAGQAYCLAGTNPFFGMTIAVLAIILCFVAACF